MRLLIVWTIFRKELIEALRDRIALLVLVGLPLLLYPLVLLTTVQVTKRQAAVQDQRVFKVAVWGVGASALFDWLTPTNNRLKLERWRGTPDRLRSELEAGRLQPPSKINAPLALPELPLGLRGHLPVPTVAPEDAVLQAARDVISSKQADVVLFVWPGFDDAMQRHDCGQVSVYYDSVIPQSAQAWPHLSGLLGRFREHLRQERQRERGLPAGFVRALDVREGDVAPLQRQISNILGRLLPIMLLTLAIVGALVSAVDMTAGEKDRATMQTLLCAPIRSLEIVVGKFLAVWSISLISAVANLFGLSFTIGRVAAALHIQVIQLGKLVLALGLLLPATWTIAALFLAVAVLARDAKDAGNFLSGLTLVVILPVTATLLPGVELDAWTCCVPLLNLSLLIRALMTGEAALPLIFITLLTSLAYAGLALALAARTFGREQSLLGGAFSWRWLLRGDRKPAGVPTPGLVLTLFPVAVVGLFYVGLWLAPHGLMVTLLGTQYGVLFFLAVALALTRGFPMTKTFSLRPPHWRSLLGAILIGLSASVGIAGLLLRLAPPPDSLLRELQELLQFGNQPAPLWKLWLLIAITPALCEETFFRGLMLSGLRRWGPWASIGLTALFFGLLHGSIYRFLPIFMLGVLLGYVVWKSGSLYCSILIHVLNNGLMATLIWSSGGKVMEVQSVPWSVILGALAITSLGVALITGPRAVAKTTSQQA